MEDTFVTEINIKKVRHLENIKVPLSLDKRKNLILTGKNGSGKTSVLTALVSFLEYSVSNSFTPEEEVRSHIGRHEAQIKQASDTEDGRQRKLQAQNILRMYEKDLKYWNEGAIAKYTSRALLKEKYERGEFILAYFGDKRRLEVAISKNIESIDPKPVYTIKDMPSRELVKYLVNLKTKQAFAQTKGDLKRTEQIANWFNRFQNILRKIYDDSSLILDFDIDSFNFSIRMHEREPFGFNTMSAGYAAVFDIISDLMMRMEHQNNYDLEGIVLIDEIETHLHVELQKNILPILTEMFPNLQFILTTHSPFILNSAENSVVYDLEKRILVENGLTNLPYDGIVEGYFDADTLSQQLRDKFERYKQLTLKTEWTNEEYAEVEALEMYLDEIPDYLALDFAAEYSRLKLEMEQRG